MDSDGRSCGDVVHYPVALHEIGLVLAVWQLADGLAGTPLGVGDDLLEGREDDFFAPAFDQLAYRSSAMLLGDLGAQVAAAKVGVRTLASRRSRTSSVLAAPYQTHGG